MKGIVFNVFTDLVEEKFGDEMLETILEDCESQLSNGGAYTAVGTYDHLELVQLVSALSQHTNIPVPQLVEAFGLYLAGVFAQKFPSFFQECANAFEFFKQIDNHIHVEVHKLHPEAELPKFDYEQISDHEFKLIYQSSRHFADLALGLLQGVGQYYGEQLEITAVDESNNVKSHVTFLIKRVDG